ncbi:MAG: hypothetical protein Q8S09_08100 [Hyphomonas sp.]|nr:hypothetical protein [Hyphomonas sp.]
MRLVPFLSSLLSLAKLDIGSFISLQAKGLGYKLVAFLFLLTAYVLAVGALAVYLAGLLSPWAALGAIALGFAGAAALVYWIGTRSTRAEAERARELADARQKATLDALTGFAVGGSSTRTLIIAALAGVLAGGLLDSRGKSDPGD